MRSDYVEAMTRLEPCCLCALYELGKALCDAGEYSEALKRFTSALLMAPPEAAQQLRLQSAWCMWRLGRSDEAQQLYWQVLDDDALCWQALLDRSRMHLALGSWASALVDLQLVIGLGQQSAEVYNDRGVCSYETGAFDRALEDFNQAIELNRTTRRRTPTAATACASRRGGAGGRLHQGDRARPEEPEELQQPRRAAPQAGKYADALSDFSEAVRLDPKYEVAVRNQQIAQRRVADVESASAGATRSRSVLRRPPAGTATGGGVVGQERLSGRGRRPEVAASTWADYTRGYNTRQAIHLTSPHRLLSHSSLSLSLTPSDAAVSQNAAHIQSQPPQLRSTVHEMVPEGSEVAMYTSSWKPGWPGPPSAESCFIGIMWMFGVKIEIDATRGAALSTRQPAS